MSTFEFGHWLLCKKCGGRELIGLTTIFGPCEVCGSSRYAEDCSGVPLVCWSEPGVPENYGVVIPSEELHHILRERCRSGLRAPVSNATAHFAEYRIWQQPANANPS